MEYASTPHAATRDPRAHAMDYPRMEVWKNGRMAGWQDGSVDDGRMEWPFSASVLLAATVGCVVHAARVACSLGPTLGTSLLVV